MRQGKSERQRGRINFTDIQRNIEKSIKQVKEERNTHSQIVAVRQKDLQSSNRGNTM